MTSIISVAGLSLLLAAIGSAQPIGLVFCDPPSKNITSGQSLPAGVNNTLKQPLENAIGRDVSKACLDQLEQIAREANHFYVLEANESAILNSELCSENEVQLTQLIRLMNWEVALRSENRNRALFKYPVLSADPDWVYRAPEISHQIAWTPINTLPYKDQFCITRTGQLRFVKFQPEMSGTYAVRRQAGVTYPSGQLEKRVLNSLWVIFHHVDFVYDSLEYFERVPVRQRMPPLSPKVVPARMYTSSEPNLRFQYRSSPEPLQAKPMKATLENSTSNGALPKPLYPEKLFKNLTIKMMWSPPGAVNEFSDWSPKCGTKITRMRFMHCAIDLDIGVLGKRLKEFGHSPSLQSEYYTSTRQLEYSKGNGLAMLYLLHVLASRLRFQLLDEARESAGRRPLFSAGLRWTKRGTSRSGEILLLNLRIPCHYTLLHHLPNTTVKSEGRASLQVYKIENTGEREQGVRLCGLSDPLELLRMMGQVLVAQLKRLVNMIRRRPVVPQRSIVTSGKTLYMKCPVDLLEFERPTCNLPDKDDNILWTLNGKSMRFFSAEVERGPSLTDECALTVKNIQANDAGEYVCYRTRMGSHSVEDKPAYRHFVEVVRPEFDPPPVEEVYFGMTVCIVWNAFMLLLWSIIAIIRSFLSLLGKEPEGPSQREVWTSFFDDDPTLEEMDEEEEEEAGSEEEDDDTPLEELQLHKSELPANSSSAIDELPGDTAGLESQGGAEGRGQGKLKSNSNQEQRGRHRWRRVRAWGKKKKD